MKRCVYTVLSGGYEPLNAQIEARDSGLPFICFTDDPDTACDGWEIRPMERVFPADHIRNQRSYKLQPHLILPEFDQSLYIDNSVQLRVTPEKIFEAADLTSGMCLPSHCHRACLADEFQAILDYGLDDPRRVTEQLEHYQSVFPEVLAGPVFWTAILLRDHHAQKVQTAMTIWLAHVYRYSRRDQLSNPVAFHMADLKPGILEINNFESEFHTWPHTTGRKIERRIWRDEITETLRAETLELRQALGESQHAHDTLLHEQGVLQNERDTLMREHGLLQNERVTLLHEHGLLQNERGTLLHENGMLQNERGTLLHEKSVLQNERDTLLQEHNLLLNHRDALLRRHDALLSSTSWRVTAPLRALKTARRSNTKQHKE